MQAPKIYKVVSFPVQKLGKFGRIGIIGTEVLFVRKLVGENASLSFYNVFKIELEVNIKMNIGMCTFWKSAISSLYLVI